MDVDSFRFLDRWKFRERLFSAAPFGVKLGSSGGRSGDLPGESQKRRRCEIDGGLNRRVGLHIILVDSAIAVELRELVHAVWRTSHHIGERALGGKRIRTLHG